MFEGLGLFLPEALSSSFSFFFFFLLLLFSFLAFQTSIFSLFPSSPSIPFEALSCVFFLNHFSSFPYPCFCIFLSKSLPETPPFQTQFAFMCFVDLFFCFDILCYCSLAKLFLSKLRVATKHFQRTPVFKSVEKLVFFFWGGVLVALALFKCASLKTRFLLRLQRISQQDN